ncbi:MerR family transcriptional regulator [Pseudoduganella violaceinigra]|uniref:MerR family transcriptional regulator n=1 Tax=Pseudoduganella violaceinigra TaxID=246602 RepID=UPI0003FA2EC5|nr:MerR family transcriptional regulator [Pseudoduganella violaceinigra]
MMLKVGELARRSGLTVRTLHHYDSIGLLKPSGRSDAGYRQYNRDDVARLHQVQALRRFGMALADIGHFLAKPGNSLPELIARQIDSLDQQIAEAAKLRAQLVLLRGQLLAGEEPELATWLTTLEQMTVYDKYFTKEELAQLPIYTDPAAREEWAQLIAAVTEKMSANVPPADASVQALAERWMATFSRHAGDNPEMMVRLDNMWAREEAYRKTAGVTHEMRNYIAAASGERKLALYAKYMLPAEVETMRKHIQCRAREWPDLIMAIRRQMAADSSPAAPQARELAQRWFELFTDMVGSAPDARLRFRTALEKEPELNAGRLMSDDLLEFLRQAHVPA